MPATKSSRRKFVPILVLAVLAVLVVGAFFFYRGFTAPALSSTVPVNPAIEERWGIRVTRIAVTADGGLVDFRYVVLDPDKALAMQQKVENLPVLVAEDSQTLINSAALMATHHNLAPGRTYFFLYRDTHGAIKHGTPVSVVFGDLRLEHIKAQ